MKKNPNEQGFTLIEVVVAVAIMGIGFVTVVNLLSKSIQSVDLSGQYLKGINLANHKISELELLDFKVDEPAGIFEQEETYHWEMALEPYESSLNVEDENIRLIQVNLKVFWDDSGTQRNLELVTLKTLGSSYPSSDQLLLGKTGKKSEGGGIAQPSLTAKGPREPRGTTATSSGPTVFGASTPGKKGTGTSPPALGAP